MSVANPEMIRWLPIPLAAEALGVSTDQLRRRVRRGGVRSRRVATEHGGPARYEVLVEDAPARPVEATHAAPEASAGGDVVWLLERRLADLDARRDEVVLLLDALRRQGEV